MSLQLAPSSPNTRSLRNAATVCIVTGIAVACVAPGSGDLPPVPDTPPETFPFEQYRHAALAGATVYTIDPGSSLVQIFVHRGGALAHLGHDHVVAGRDVKGFVIRESGAGGTVVAEGHLYLPLGALTVDEQSLREAAGIDREISESARLGTKSNMLTSLEADRFPFVSLYARAEFDGAAAKDAKLQVTIVMHGVTKSLEIPADVEFSTGSLEASGEFSLDQSDFDIEPHTALAGAIAVQDRVDIRFSITAMRYFGQ